MNSDAGTVHSMLCTRCSQPVKPIVAIDIDGVLGQYHEHLLDFFDHYFDRKFPRGWDGSGNWEDYLGLPHEKYSDAKLAFRQGGFKRWMPRTQGADDITGEIRDAGAEVWITTTRPYLRLDSVDPDSRWWLDRNNICYDHLLYDDEKYSRLAALVSPGRVVAVLDDLPAQYIKAAIEFGEEAPLLMIADHNAAWRNDADAFTGVSNLLEAETMIVDKIEEWVKHA